MTDQSGYGGVTTNGTHRVADDEPPTPTAEAGQFQSGQSVDERLEALREAIRTWDWRTASVQAGPPSPGDMTPPVVRDAADDGQVVLDPVPHPVTAPPLAEDRAADSETFLLAPMPRPAPVDQPTADDPDGSAPAVEPESPAPLPVDPPMLEEPTGVTQTVVLEPTPAPETLHQALAGDEPEPSRDADSSLEPAAAPRRRSESRRGPIGRLWAHRWTKVAVLCLAAVLAVVLIIWGIRLAHKGSGSPSLPPPSTAAQHATSHSTQAAVAPLDSAQLAQYEQYAAGLQKANTVATNGFVSAGSTPTAAQVAPVVAAYRTAVNLYDFQLHFIQWPASMQTAIQADHAQLTALNSFLQAFSLVSPTGTGAWLSNLRNRASAAETADNQVRRDLGLPSSSNFP